MTRLLLAAILTLVAFALGSGYGSASPQVAKVAGWEDERKKLIRERDLARRNVRAWYVGFRAQQRGRRQELARADRLAGVLERIRGDSEAQQARGLQYWINRQISAATIIGRESKGDPWPNCPDPFDGGGYSWWDTVRCENGGNWLDSPGYYRCGLQFDPSWERRFGRLCP